MTNLDAVVQVRPVDRVAARFELPVGALPGRGFRQPFQPRHLRQRQTDAPAIVELNMEHATGETNAGGANLVGGSSGQSTHAMPPKVGLGFVRSSSLLDSVPLYCSRGCIQLRATPARFRPRARPG